MNVEVKVIFFAKARELSGRKESLIRLPAEITYSHLLDQLAEKFNFVEIKNSVVLALNEEYINHCINITLKNTDILAVIPPISNIISKVFDESCGGNSVFIGTTRQSTSLNNANLVYLEYEGYESMAVKVFKAICTETRSKWPQLRHIAVVHRIGKVCLKEASIIIATSSPHRKDALESMQWLLEKVKSSVPIFKKEVYDDGTHKWI